MADEAELNKALALEVRRRIYTVIQSSPGLHFREIQRRTNLAVGSLQYHLDYLQKHHIIRPQTEGKFVRYYSVRGTRVGETQQHQEIMAFLRHDSARKIILFLLQEKRANNEAIAKQISLSPSTTSWHLDKLREAEVVNRVREGRKSYFTLTDPEAAQEMLITFQQSFVDVAVDNFVEMVQALTPEKGPQELDSGNSK
jgi:predicted transcriptional regulator